MPARRPPFQRFAIWRRAAFCGTEAALNLPCFSSRYASGFQAEDTERRKEPSTSLPPSAAAFKLPRSWRFCSLSSFCMGAAHTPKTAVTDYSQRLANKTICTRTHKHALQQRASTRQRHSSNKHRSLVLQQDGVARSAARRMYVHDEYAPHSASRGSVTFAV
jgi:hypothetical protein